MRLLKTSILALAVIGGIAGAGFAADPAPLPTDAQLAQLLDQKQYRACLQQSARVLSLRGDDARKYDPFVLQMRRGECLLNLGDQATALLAYNAALNAATQPRQMDDARVMIALIKASRNLQYIPKGGQPISIVAFDTRAAAIQALYKDQVAAGLPEMVAAQQARNLEPIIKIIPACQSLHALEMVAVGNDDQTRPVLLGMGDRARTLIVQELNSINRNIENIQARANQMVASGSVGVTDPNGGLYLVPDTRMGLAPEDRDTLRGLIPYLDQIITTCQRGKQVARTFGADGSIWDPMVADAESVSHRAQEVLAAE